MYFNKCGALIEEFKNDIKKEFDNIKTTEGVMNSGTPYVSVHGREIIEKLIKYLPCYKSKNIFIPEEIIKSKDLIIREYLRVLYDDEGCASLRINQKTNSWKRSITLASNSYKILLQIKMILKKLKINTNKIIRNNSKSNYDLSYVLAVTGKENFVLFQEKIGFKHPRKSKMLQLINESYGANYGNQEKFNKIKEKLSELVCSLKLKGGQLTRFPT